MSKQNFDAETREAFLIAYGRKCVYTGEIIDPQSMHIDHVIPESLLEDPCALAELRQKVGLPDDFNVLGFENLVASRGVRNLQKRDLEFSLASLHYFLNIAASKKPAIETNLKKIRNRNDRGRALLVIQQMLERGLVKPDDIAGLVTQPPAEVFRLAEEMHFGDASTVNSISKADLAELAARPVGLGGNTHLDGLPLGSDSGEERVVRTCAEYQTAIRDGFYARNTFEMTIAVFFEHQCGLLSALERAQLSEVSFIADPRVGLADVRLLPFSFFPDPAASADGTADDHAGITYEDKIRSGDLVVKAVGSNRLTVEGDGMGQHLVEALRADFDGDGIEEMLVFEYCYATGDAAVRGRDHPGSQGPLWLV
ncbi:MAG: hypothetical protein LC804_03130 [Acidobacteria bacterium]|nr:hypothetical protein [Acidobacteriota bacterium]